MRKEKKTNFLKVSFLRGILLAAMLVLVLVAISNLKKEKHAHRINDVVGLPTAKTSKGQKSLSVTQPEGNLFWCKTRVHSMKFKNKEIFEKRRKWLAVSSDSPKETELNYLKVEKWLASYCSLVTYGLAVNPAPEEFKEKALCVSFITDKDNYKCFYKTPQSLSMWSWKGRIFGSAALRKALEKLESL